MTSYLLDTDTVSYALRGQAGVAERILAQKPSALAISAITLSELIFGAERRQSKKLFRLIDTFIHDVSVLAFDDKAARIHGQLAAQLAKEGTPIGNNDTMIAAHALATERTLISNNRRHFGKISQLITKTWADQ